MFFLSLTCQLKGCVFVSQVKNCTVHINDDSIFEPEEEFQVHLGTPQGDHWSGAMVGANDIVTITITNDEDGKQAPHNLNVVPLADELM